MGQKGPGFAVLFRRLIVAFDPGYLLLAHRSIPFWGFIILLMNTGCGEDEVPATTANGMSETRPHEVPVCSDLADAGVDPAPRLRTEPVAEGLVVPWAIDFAPDGRIFLTERPGRIRIIENGALVEDEWAELDVYQEGEAGLMGIALAPDFETSGHVYVAGTFHASRSGPAWTQGIERVYRRASLSMDPLPSRQAGGIEVRVYRLTERDGRGEDLTPIVEGIPGGRLQVGTTLAFGPDGSLYVTTGDVLEPGLAQDSSSLAGKILRYRPDGTIPDDNPTEGSPVLAVGLRNVQGLDWHPETEDLFVTDHGPSGLPTEGDRTGGDELNRIVPRGNYGWPAVAGLSDEPDFIPPLSEWTPAIAPSGIAIYSGEALPWFGNVLIGALRGEHLRRVVIEEDRDLDTGWRVICEEALFESEFGRIREVRAGPDGAIYLTTSNQDGRGRPASEDDRLLRILPEDPQ